jgi:hypothetical protein
MSTTPRKISCTGCDFEGYLRYRPLKLVYHFDDGTEVRSHRAFGWCFTCDCVQDLEGKLTALSELESELTGIQATQGRAGHRFKNWLSGLTGQRDDELAERAQELAEQIKLGKRRGDRCRCLRCGSAETQVCDFDDMGVWQGFVHHCGGQLALEPTDPDAPRLSFRPETIHLDEDGRRLTGDDDD